MDHPCICNPFCSALDIDTRQELCRHVIVTSQKPKEFTSSHGHEQIEIIAEGIMLMFTLSEDGDQQSVEVVRPGDLVGTHHFARKKDYPECHMLSLTYVKKCIFPVSVIEHLFQENHAFAYTLLQNIADRHVRNSMHWVKMHAMKSDEKVVYIYRLLEGEGVDMTRITQDDLALISGVSRISVARAMKKIY